ncbi:MAG: HAS-barrel domain-containing protein, partial [Cyanobacteria bacterium J06553_1]
MREMRPLGSVIQGSLSKGLEVRLHPDVLVEEMRVGKFLVVQGVRSRFFCMLTDVALGMASQRIVASPPEPSNIFLQEVLAGSGTYGTVDLTPMLMFTPTEEGKQRENGQSSGSSNGLASYETNSSAPLQLLPVKTIPGHFSQVYD